MYYWYYIYKFFDEVKMVLRAPSGHDLRINGGDNLMSPRTSLSVIISE